MNRFLGTCQNESLVEELFGSVSEFARLVELHGNNFKLGNILVEYDPETDIHRFFEQIVLDNQVVT